MIPCLSVARNSLGSISTLFLVPPEVQTKCSAYSQAHQTDKKTSQPKDLENKSNNLSDVVGEVLVDDLYKDIQAKGLEFTKDKVNQLDWQEMQELVAGLLRAMGYKTRISPSGSDRGKEHCGLTRRSWALKTRES